MIEWKLLEPRNFVVIATISMLAYVAFLHFNHAVASKSGDVGFDTQGV